jgi:NAD(P)-dependent dehydrogenase (short-subunit alcohol dehydrogenase family)
MTDSARPDGLEVDPRHVLVIGAGPGLGSAIAQRFAQGGYHLTLMARHADGLAKLASDLVDGGAPVDTVAADASDPDGLRATLTSLYASTGAPGVLVYNASMLTPDSLLSSDVAHLHQAYDVDVVGAIVATQVAAPAMRAAGGGTILFTGGGWADHPGAAWGTVSLGKAALRSAATMLGADLAGDGIRVASITIAGQIRPGTPFSPDQIAEKYWSVVQSEGIWHSEFRFDGT